MVDFFYRVGDWLVEHDQLRVGTWFWYIARALETR